VWVWLWVVWWLLEVRESLDACGPKYARYH
jgi:hypothetical protein